MRPFAPRISLAAIGLVAILATIISLLLRIAWWKAFAFGFLGILLNGVFAPRRDPPADS